MMKRFMCPLLTAVVIFLCLIFLPVSHSVSYASMEPVPDREYDEDVVDPEEVEERTTDLEEADRDKSEAEAEKEEMKTINEELDVNWELVRRGPFSIPKFHITGGLFNRHYSGQDLLPGIWAGYKPGRLFDFTLRAMPIAYNLEEGRPADPGYHFLAGMRLNLSQGTPGYTNRYRLKTTRKSDTLTVRYYAPLDLEYGYSHGLRLAFQADRSFFPDETTAEVLPEGAETDASFETIVYNLDYRTQTYRLGWGYTFIKNYRVEFEDDYRPFDRKFLVDLYIDALFTPEVEYPTATLRFDNEDENRILEEPASIVDEPENEFGVIGGVEALFLQNNYTLGLFFEFGSKPHVRENAPYSLMGVSLGYSF